MLWPAQLQTLPLVKGRWHQREAAFGSVCKIRFIFTIHSRFVKFVCLILRFEILR